MTKPRLRLYGSPFVEDDSGVIRHVRSKMVWQLLGCLALRPGTWIERSVLSRRLWPDAGHERSRHNLRQTIQYLRKSIPGSAEWLEVDASGMRIKADAVDLETHSESEIGGLFLEAHDNEWIHAARLNFIGKSENFESLPMQSSNDLLEHLSPNAMRSAILGLTPGWLATGKFSTGIRFISEFLSNCIGGGIEEVLLCSAELHFASHRINRAKQLVQELSSRKSQLLVTSRIRLALLSARSAYRDGDLRASKHCATEAYQISNQESDEIGIKRSLAVLILCAIDQGELEKAEPLVRRANEVAGAHPDAPWSPVLEYYCFWFRSLSTGLRRSDKGDAIEIVSRLANLKEPATHGIYIARLGRVYESIGDQDFAKELYMRSIEVLRQTECTNEIAEAQTYLGDVYRRYGNFAESLAAQLEAVAIRREINLPMGLATSLRGAGMATLELRYEHQAIQYLKEAESLYTIMGDAAGACSVRIPMARALYAVGRNREAITMFDDSLRYLASLPEVVLRAHFPEDLQSLSRLQTELSDLKTT